MNAKETIMYLYGHGHIPSSLHFKTIMEELEKPITNHPDVQKLISKMVVLQASHTKLMQAAQKMVDYMRHPPCDMSMLESLLATNEVIKEAEQALAEAEL